VVFHCAIGAVALLGVVSGAGGQCEAAKLAAQDPANADLFGTSVSVSGEVALIGVPLDDDAGSASGSAYVFEYDAELHRWKSHSKLTALDAAPDSAFGNSVDIDGGVAVIGAPLDQHGCEKECNYGSAYVFRFDGLQWLQEQKLIAADPSIGDGFGSAVAISGEVLVVGVAGDDVVGANSGSACVYRYHRGDLGESIWVREAFLTASDAGAGDLFGQHVAVSGDVALISAILNDDVGVYVFRFDGRQWVEEVKLVGGDAAPNQAFGASVSIDGEVALIGSPATDDAGPNAGSAYFFRYDGGTGMWTEEAKITGSDTGAGDSFGWATVSGELAVIGARRADDACPADPDCDSGSAYLFHYDPQSGLWAELAKFVASDAEAGDEFGMSVSVSGPWALVGARLSDDAAPASGSAYVFGLDGPDCNGNGLCDDRDIFEGQSDDANDNGIPDECECPADLDGDTNVGITDFLALLASWGACPGPCPPACPADLDGDCTVGITDFLVMLAAWGPCA
jgi:hypothetical protein